MYLRRILVLKLLFVCNLLQAQKEVHLQMEDGTPFRVFLQDRLVTDSAQVHAIITGIRHDTLSLKIETSSGNRYGITLFLLDKGKPTNHKEFTYLLRKEKNKIMPVFMGMQDLNPLQENRQ